MNPDRPITTKDEDKLNRLPFAARMAEVIGQWKDIPSLVIGLFGEWGEGKTSALNLMAAELDKEKVILIRFNPWYFSSIPELIRQFFDVLGSRIGKKIKEKSKREEIALHLSKYGKLLSRIPTQLVGIPNIGSAVEAIGGALTDEGDKSDLEEIKSQIEQLLGGINQRVVVLIDDVDRLDKEEVTALFKLVKLAGDFPNTTYVLAFDPDQISRMLSERYGNPDQTKIGSDFLEKIIQVRLHLPTAEPRLIRLTTLEGVFRIMSDNHIELSEDDVHHFVNVWDRSVGPQIRTMRKAKGYLNSLSFALPLLKGEVNEVDHLLIEALRSFFPAIYDYIRRNPEDIFRLGRKGEISQSAGIKGKFEEIINGFTKIEQDSARVLIQELFPQTKLIWSNTKLLESSWGQTWIREKKVCSDSYFHRYFQYAIPSGDVPDVKVDQLVEISNNKDASDEELGVRIKDMKGNYGARALADKLGYLEDKLSEFAARRLAMCLGKVADNLPKNDGFLGTIGSTRDSWSKLVARLIRKTSRRNRLNIAKEFMAKCISLPVCAEVTAWLKPHKDEKILSEGETKIITTLIANRIQKEAKNAEYFDFYGDDIPLLYSCWKHGSSAKIVVRHLTGLFESSVENAAKFVASYLGYGTSMETGLKHRVAFMRDHYDAVVSVYPADKLAEFLSKKYKPSESQVFKTDTDRLHDSAAEQFLRFHEIMKADKSQGKSAESG